MNILITYFCCIILSTVQVSHSASPSPSPSRSIISIPLYHKGIQHLQKEATSDIYPIDNAYAIFLWIGTPVQVVLLMVDIGSPISWSQCDPCNSCYPMQRPAFNTRASSTFKEVGSYSDTCLIPMMREVFGNSTGWTCRYNVKYGYGSTTSYQSHSFGQMVTDTLNLEHSNTEVKNFIIGCGDSYEGPFRTQFSGVLGLGRGPLSIQSQLKAKAFSFCPVSQGSEKPSSLEFYDTPPEMDQHGSNSIMVALTENGGYPFHYFLQFVGIGVDGFMLDIQSRVWGYGLNYDGGVIIDIGTMLTYLPTDAYSVFRSEILRTDHNRTATSGHEGLEFCYKNDSSNVFPTIELHFENGNIAGQNFVSYKLNNNQLLFTPEEGTVCLSFAEGKSSALTVIGSNQLQGTLLSYDLVDQILVLTFDKCSRD